MNVTRFSIHVTSEEPLGDVARYDLRFVLKRVLKAQLEAGEINAPRFERERPAVTQLYVAEVNPTTPRDATQAANEGFPARRKSVSAGFTCPRQMGQSLGAGRAVGAWRRMR
jgi:hypothetical protein